MTKQFDTIGEMLMDKFEELTRAERQVANQILENYPVGGLSSITAVAKNAQVSTPSVVRMVQKLGFKGFTDFQAELRRELEAKISNPMVKHEASATSGDGEHILNRFTRSVLDNIQNTVGNVNLKEFDEVAALMGDKNRALYVTGGRISRVLSDYLFLHMQMIRPGVTHVQSISNAWPHFLLDMKEGDVLVIFDLRRYENSTLKLAELAQERGVKIVLFTDQWRSPVTKYASYCLSARIEVPSAWDSSVSTMLLLEALISSIQERNWDDTRARNETLEEMFDRTRFFRKFN